MPTPSTSSPHLSTPILPIEAPSTRPTCPPDHDAHRDSWREQHIRECIEHDTDGGPTPTSASFPAYSLNRPLDDAVLQTGTNMSPSPQSGPGKSDRAGDEEVAVGPMSPVGSVSTDGKYDLALSRQSTMSSVASLVPSSSNSSSSMNYEYSNVRLLPNHTSSYLRAGSKFVGTQQSDRQIYNVDVEIKHVDIAESYLCGYLRIQGLTEDHPTLTTFFEAEIIGTKYTFQTCHESWGATDRTDMHHWAKFPAWRPLAKMARKPDFSYKDFAQHEHLFMRWKEYFLVPDHRVKSISGASFEGFYYICFNQFKGTVSGIYYHAKSEKYQQLELKHVENRGCFGAMEFR